MIFLIPILQIILIFWGFCVILALSVSLQEMLLFDEEEIPWNTQLSELKV